MEDEVKQRDPVLDFWSSRAGLKAAAGSNDLLAKMLEIEAIAKFVRDGMRILEIGCGNGVTAMELSKRFDVALTGIDFSNEMIAEATLAANSETFKGSVQFVVGDVRSIGAVAEGYDLAFTERVLINLPDWETQRQSIADILSKLRPGGCYVMCENSQDGLDKINNMRISAGLACIAAPWHNRYFRDAEIEAASFPDARLEEVVHYSSTYYFLSRVVNAWLAARDGQDPRYDAPVNQLALSLPSIGEFGQGRIWLWRKI